MIRNTPYWLNYIYTGQMFFSWSRGTVADGETAYTLIRCPTIASGGRIVHILNAELDFNGGGPYNIGFFKNPVINAAGTLWPYEPTGINNPVGISNYDQRFSDIAGKQPTATIESGPTVDLTNAQQIRREYVAATGTGANTSGSGRAFSLELVLEPGENFVLALTNNGQNPGTVHLQYIFYESGN